MSESKPNQVKVPVAVLKAGETRSIQTVLEFPDSPVTFKLVEGNGPVYIHGQQVPGNYEIEDTTELSGEEEEVCNWFVRVNVSRKINAVWFWFAGRWWGRSKDQFEGEKHQKRKEKLRWSLVKLLWSIHSKDLLAYICHAYSTFPLLLSSVPTNIFGGIEPN